MRHDPARFRPRDLRAFEDGRRLREEAARRRRQRHRVRVRRAGQGRGARRAAPVVQAAGILALVVVVSAATAAPLAPGFGLIAVLFALVVLNRVMAWRLVTATATTAPVPLLDPPSPAPDVAWRGAKERFGNLRGAYAAFECDAMQVLRLPALADVTVPSTGRFVDAFAEAQALDTDAFPGPVHGERFAVAVEGAERAWGAAHDAAERIRLSTLSPTERATVERIIKLLTTARDSDNEPERLAAYTRARAELTKLDQTGVLHVPLPAQAALDDAARGQLPT